MSQDIRTDVSQDIRDSRSTARCSGVSKARLVITAVIVESRPVAEVARRLRRVPLWVYPTLARYRRRRRGRLRATVAASAHLADRDPAGGRLILRLRKQLTDAGLDAGADTIAWHLTHHHQITVSPGHDRPDPDPRRAVTPDPSKRPKSSYLRFEADACPTRPGSPTSPTTASPTRRQPRRDVEIITWLDDHSRYALHISAHRRVTAPIVLDHLPASR